MTRTVRSPFVALLAAFILTFSFTTLETPAAAKKTAKPAAKKAAAKSARPSKTSAREKASAKSRDRRDTAKNTKASKNDKRASARDNKRESARARREDNDRASRGSKGKLSRREQRAELARRRREEAARRAEAARQAAIARAIAIARQRAADQALRDEAVTNILKDDTTGEDMEVRRVAVEALGNRAGTVVVMNPKTGQVYTAVNQDWAYRKGFKPCSTIKLVSGVAGLSENIINPTQTVNISTGSFRLDLTDSLAYSNNTYFQIVGGNVGFDKMMTYAREMGLGQPTGVNHAGESAGRLPFVKSGYAVNRMSSHGDDIETTPLQLANMASTIANGGTLLIPHLPRTPQENVSFKTEVKRKVNIPDEHLKRLVPGMIGAVSYGTARGANDPTQTVAGKTGTCIGQGSWLGLFTSYAPVHDPKLAVAVVTRGSGERGRIAAAVAGKIYRGLNHRFGNRGGAAPLMATEKLAPRPKIDPRAAAAISDEDREADAYVVSEAEGVAGSVNATPRSGIQQTLQTVPRQTEVTTRPAVRPAASASPAAPGTKLNPERPRRVLENSPE